MRKKNYMKGTGKIVLSVFGMTSFFLIYVHGQVALFDLSYRLERKQEVLAERSESYRQLKFHVDQLKAPRLLEHKMGELSMELAMPKDIRVVRVPVPQGFTTSGIGEVTTMPFSERLSGLIGRWVGIAQAKTDN